jgi:hypothetical protein
MVSDAAYSVVGARVGVEDKSNNQTVQTENLGENEDKNLFVSLVPIAGGSIKCLMPFLEQEPDLPYRRKAWAAERYP